MKRFKEMAVILFLHYWQQVLRRRRWRMILFTCFGSCFDKVPACHIVPPGVGQPDIWGLGLGLGVINMMEFY